MQWCSCSQRIDVPSGNFIGDPNLIHDVDLKGVVLHVRENDVVQFSCARTMPALAQMVSSIDFSAAVSSGLSRDSAPFMCCLLYTSDAADEL